MDKMSKRKKTSDVGEAYDNYPNKRQKQEDLEVTGVSRSGRVRKKSSKLMDFESPDEIDNRYKRRDRNDMPPVMSNVMGGGRGRKPQSSVEKSIKVEHQQDLSEGEDMQDDYPSKGDNGSSGSDSELGMYPPPEGVEDDSSIDSLGSDVDEDEDMDEDSLVMDERSDSHKSNVRRDSQVSTPTQAQSLYMLEKSSKKKLIIRDGKIVGRMKAQRKDKGKSRFTAYMLWAKEIRQEILRVNPDMDFATMSKRLGELWATVPTSEKYGWKRRAKRMAVKGNYRDSPSNTGAGDSGRMKAPQSRSKFINKLGGRTQHNTAPISNRVTAVSSVAQQQQQQHHQQQQQQTPVLQLPSPNAIGNVNVTMSPPENKTQKAGLVTEPIVGPGLYKVVGTQPVDVAAHLKLLGESLSIIGERLKEHEGQIAVSGSLSVLLDSLLCALGPLLCLTQQVPETNGCPQELLNKILDNIAYFMPGL